jgi:glycosyltransferase involved in cell wall biosynthesis
MNDSKINITILCTGLHGIGGGVANHIIKWLKHIDRTLFNVKFIYYSKDKETFEKHLVKEKVSLSGDVIFVKREKILFPLFSIIKIAKYLKVLKTDILHSVFLQSDIIGVISGKLAGIKILISNVEGKLIPENVNILKKTLYNLGNKMVRKYFNKSIIVSNGLYKYLTENKQITNSRTEIVHIGAEPRKIVRNNSRGFRKVGSISRLSKEKGVEYFVKAIPLILQSYQEVRFVIEVMVQKERAWKLKPNDLA